MLLSYKTTTPNICKCFYSIYKIRRIFITVGIRSFNENIWYLRFSLLLLLSDILYITLIILDSEIDMVLDIGQNKTHY